MQQQKALNNFYASYNKGSEISRSRQNPKQLYPRGFEPSPWDGRAKKFDMLRVWTIIPTNLIKENLTLPIETRSRGAIYSVIQ